MSDAKRWIICDYCKLRFFARHNHQIMHRTCSISFRAEQQRQHILEGKIPVMENGDLIEKKYQNALKQAKESFHVDPWQQSKD